MIIRIVLFVAFVGAVLYIAPLVTKQSTPSPTPRPATPTATVPVAIASGIATIDSALKQATQSGRAVPITLRVTDADLTAAAQPYFPQSYAGITVAEPSVRIGSGMTLTAKASSILVSGALVANATPFASAGRLLVRLDSASVGGIALPEAARSQLEQQLQSALNASISSKLQVTTVTLTQGVATISGSALP